MCCSSESQISEMSVDFDDWELNSGCDELCDVYLGVKNCCSRFLMTLALVLARFANCSASFSFSSFPSLGPCSPFLGSQKPTPAFHDLCERNRTSRVTHFTSYHRWMMTWQSSSFSGAGLKQNTDAYCCDRHHTYFLG